MSQKNCSKIIGIQFSILSPEEIRKLSVVEIESRDTYINNKPVPRGLFDSRMGVLEPGTICPTDGMSYIDTPGYFGHIELARPVFFIQHLKEIIKRIAALFSGYNNFAQLSDCFYRTMVFVQWNL